MSDHTIVAQYLNLLARVALTAPDHLRALLHNPGVTDGSPPQVLARLLQLVDQMLTRFGCVGGACDPAGPWRRKLVALALVSLLTADLHVLRRLNAALSVSSVSLDVLAEQPTPGLANQREQPGVGPVRRRHHGHHRDWGRHGRGPWPHFDRDAFGHQGRRTV
jgi:hypothetical protein